MSQITPWPKTRGRTSLPRFTAQVIEPDGTPGAKLPLDTAAPGRIDWSRAESPLGATMTIHGGQPVLAEGQTIQLGYQFDGVRFDYPPMAPQAADDLFDTSEWFDLSVIDPTSDLAADGLDFPLVLQAGTPIMAAAAAVMRQSRPSQLFTLPDLDLTLRNQLDWGIGTDHLLIFNALMEAAGCTQLAPTVDSPGLVVQPWTAPGDRPVRMAFGPGDGAGMLPDVRTPSDFLGTPNVAHYEAAGSATSDALVGRWRDEDPTSPWSIGRRRKRILAPKGSGQAANQLIADQQAMRIGLDHPRRGRTATIRGGFQPVFPGHIITTRHPKHPKLAATWEVLTVSTDMGLEAMTTWTIKEVPK